MTVGSGPATPRLTQDQRRSRSRQAILESAARGLSRVGYGSLSLAEVAREAGYTRGALYHQFDGKDDLALAVVSWVRETWQHDVGFVLEEGGAQGNSADTLIELARRHAIYCRRDVAAVLLTLRVEFDKDDHPVGRAIDDGINDLVRRCSRLIKRGRADGSIPAGAPMRLTAHALVSAIESVGIAVAGRPPHDVLLAERTARGILGLPPAL